MSIQILALWNILSVFTKVSTIAVEGLFMSTHVNYLPIVDIRRKKALSVKPSLFTKSALSTRKENAMFSLEHITAINEAIVKEKGACLKRIEETNDVETLKKWLKAFVIGEDPFCSICQALKSSCVGGE